MFFYPNDIDIPLLVGHEVERVGDGFIIQVVLLLRRLPNNDDNLYRENKKTLTKTCNT